MSDLPQLALAVEDAAEILRVMGHPVRLRLMLCLAMQELAVGEIEEATGVQQPGLSQQLSILRKAELVETRRESKQVFYSLNQGRLDAICHSIGWMRQEDALLQGAGGQVAGVCSALVTSSDERGRKLGTMAVFAKLG